MATDPFDDLLELENNYYTEGYDAGVADSTYAGIIEGKAFGIEKGYEKALDLGMLHGRALIWQERLRPRAEMSTGAKGENLPSNDLVSSRLVQIFRKLQPLPDGGRLRRHVEGLHATSDTAHIAKDNSEEAVTEFDDRIAKSKAKAKIIANIAGEPLNPGSKATAGIEDATGLQARH